MYNRDMQISFIDSLLGDSNETAEESAIVYLEHLRETAIETGYGGPENFLYLPSDDRISSSVTDIIATLGGERIRYVILIGIGGSILGARAVYESIKGNGVSANGKEVFFIESNDAATAKNLTERFADVLPEEILIIIASKSGKTIETISNAEYIVGELAKNTPSITGRVVVVSDDGSPLWRSAMGRGIAVLSTPATVSGRYSVFSALGILPLGVSGIDTGLLREGAVEMRNRCLSNDLKSNPAFQSARFLYEWHQRGRRIHDAMFFQPHLEALGKWYRQLLGESIGKTNDIGITPTVSIGSSDLHSVGQLNLGGPEDKTSMIIRGNYSDDINVPEELLFPGIVPRLAGRPFSFLNDAFYSGTVSAYRAKRIPFIDVQFEALSEREIGAFLMWKLCEVALLGNFFGINAFDQPHVEFYKKETELLLFSGQ